MYTYTESYDGAPRRKVHVNDVGRGKMVVSSTDEQRNRFSLDSARLLFISVFMPQGYPSSVSEDYLSYQIWDTIQAFASSMTGALATEAVLKGAGVGNEKASALAASLAWLVKDGLGMLGRIVFTYFKGTDLDSNPKKWRLVADILNDVAFCLDLLSPSLPGFFLPLACTSSLFRCVVGVAGGATRTAITQHQARRDNLADVAAKDGSQETLVNVVALVSSLLLLPAVSGHQTLIWILFALFTIIHLFANYRAVRSLSIQSLNRNRAGIVIRSYLLSGSVPSVKETNEQEPLFYSVCGQRNLGSSLSRLLKMREKMPEAYFCSTEYYTVLYCGRRNIGWIAMAEDCTTPLLAFYHIQCVQHDKKFILEEFNKFVSMLKEKEYLVDTLHLGFDCWTYRKNE